MHQILAKEGFPLKLNPILRVRYSVWDALQVSCSWLHLPEPFQGPFGAEEMCAPSFASRWQAVGAEQSQLLDKLGQLRSPIDLIRFLESSVGGSWSCLATEYEELHGELEKLKDRVDAFATARRKLYTEVKSLKAQRVELERSKGEHFRSKIFEREPSKEAMAKRAEFDEKIDRTIQGIEGCRHQIRDLMRHQRVVAQEPEVLKVHERRRSIELEAELKRLRLIRNAVISSKGLSQANRRPSAWWFPLACPDGLWFRETVDSARCYLEPLV